MTNAPIPEPTVDELIKRWKATPALRPNAQSIRDLLTDDYKAYKIPIRLMEPDGFEHDEEVRRDLIDSLYTVTDPVVLENLLAGYRADEDAAEFGEVTECYRRELIDGDIDELPYRVMSAQHALGQRVSILLEREGTSIAGFKVYGIAGDQLTERLIALIGFPIRRPQDPEDGPYMRPGDRSDPAFLESLELAARHGLI